MQIISEILSAENNDENIINNLIIICKLLYVSNINNKIKQKIFVDIISKQNLISIDDFWEVYNRENISLLNEMNKEYINGIFYLNKNELFMAYKSLLKSKRYKNAIDIYLKYCFLLINQNKINDINFKEIYTNLKEMNEKAPLLFNDFYLDFSSFVSYKVFKDRIDYKEIMDLLQKFINKYSGKNKIIYLDDISYRFIISELCQLLKEKRDKNNNLIICGELKLNELEEITCEDKNNVLNDVFKDLIEHKNTQFYINEF
jgi:predicted transcriptional regulator